MNPDEPQYPVAAPDRPAVLLASPAAVEEWDRIVSLMTAQRVASPAYRSSIAAYCLAWGRSLEAEQDPTATRKQRIDARADLRQWVGALGLTPTSSAKVHAGREEKPDNPLEALQRATAANRVKLRGVALPAG